MVSMVRKRQKIPPPDSPPPAPDTPEWAGADAAREPPPPPSPDSPGPLADWITLWHSELAALAVDREAQEAAQALIGLWASTAQSLAAGIGPRADEPAPGRPRPAEPPRPAAAAAAPAAGDDGAELARLRARLADMESRIAELELRRPAPRPRRPGRRPG